MVTPNVNIGVKSVSLEAVKKAAEENYAKGYYCCESLVYTIKQMFELDIPDAVIAMSSGMAVGAGRSGCMCGALNGGILTLGLLFGRTEQDGPTNPKSIKTMELTNELHDWFREANGKHSCCCRVLTREFDMAQGEHKAQCIRFTGLAAWKVAEIICRECGIEATE